MEDVRPLAVFVTMLVILLREYLETLRFVLVKYLTEVAVRRLHKAVQGFEVAHHRAAIFGVI
jgi:hypothetical protein